MADVIFVTDPMCSWCWGMADAIDRVRRELRGEFGFELRLGGINVGSSRGVSEFARARLAGVWRDVALVTGAAFGRGLPEGEFVYDSTDACVAVEAVRTLTGGAPFEFVHELQRRFFVEGHDVTALPVLADAVASLGIDAARFREVWLAPETRQRVVEGFATAKSHATAALPRVLLEDDAELRLVAGGYVDAPTLVAALRQPAGMA